ncbi:hypothetical protein [Rubellimicrobium roseum]|uniref:Uncharacterized protein n=1 Tax=Rubellimicrobium roseum TaxID=687525 RepID=A0A5C4NCT1_9RHOB|nr:hypothetical protein [Rubellimicrobium roseum]TNC72581.1 hypothetical protein FHG71_07875 [Rubellimicrobium roseum]
MNTSTILAALAIWAAMAVCAVANGILRETALVPALGAGLARPLSAAMLVGVVLGLTWVFLRWQGPLSAGALWGIGAAWVVGTLVFETGVGRTEGRSWTEIAANYDPTQPTLWVWVVVFILAAPFLVAQLMR